MSDPITYVDRFITRSYAQTVYASLYSDLAWLRVTRRYEYWTTTFQKPYTYGKGNNARTYQPQPCHPMIEEIRLMIVCETEHYLEGCFLNRYEDGKDALGWHADDDPAIDHSRPIAVVTLGAGRNIQYKKQIKGEKPTTQFLDHGSLLLMHPGMQQTHFHQIPKVNTEIGPRISLTFRGLIPN